jgi:hypothetical protein
MVERRVKVRDGGLERGQSERADVPGLEPRLDARRNREILEERLADDRACPLQSLALGPRPTPGTIAELVNTCGPGRFRWGRWRYTELRPVVKFRATFETNSCTFVEGAVRLAAEW